MSELPATGIEGAGVNEAFGLRDKTVLYTGAAGLIGSDACMAFAREGAKVAMADVDKGRLEELAHRILKEMPTAKILPISGMDMNDPGDVDRRIESIHRELGTIDCLVNSAYPRTSDWHLKFEDLPNSSWRKNVDDHLNGYFNVTQRVSLGMMERKRGNIVNFGSIYGLVGPDFKVYDGLGNMTMPAAYSAIKGGIVNFTRYLASYLGPYNVRVNCICPGGVSNGQDPRFVASYEARVPLGRMAEVNDVIPPLLFLASEMATYVTGVILPVDGGWTAI